MQWVSHEHLSIGIVNYIILHNNAYLRCVPFDFLMSILYSLCRYSQRDRYSLELTQLGSICFDVGRGGFM